MVEVESFYKYLISNGYYFDKELIENYLLSLKVKPFVILTGNSGTGKTKLSQLFANFLNSNFYHKTKVTTRGRSWGYKKSDGTEGDSCGWSLLYEYAKEYFPLDDLQGSCKIEVGGFSSTADIRLTPQLYYDKHNEPLKEYFKNLYFKEEEIIKKDKEEGKKHKKQLADLFIDCDGICSVFSKNANIKEDFVITMNNIDAFLSGSVQLSVDIFNYVPIHSKSECKIIGNNVSASAYFDFKYKLFNYLTPEIKKYLNDLKNKGKTSFKLLISGFHPDISDFKPNWDLIEIAKSNGNNQKNHMIIPVGANWTDNTNILGFHNVITNKYQSTPSYNLIKNAIVDSINPYFLILDEMNLSHVERYFADFLSAIESGEDIPLFGEEDSLKLPNNLFTIGTVNVDETTYMFSPKVLDRANTIEFDTLSVDKYMSSDFEIDDFGGDIKFLQSPLDNLNVSKMDINDLKIEFESILCENNLLWDILSDELMEFQKVLKGSGFEFGFRIINEILRFMLVAWKYDNSQKNWNTWERYFDAQVKQKILPKLHGSEKAIGDVITKLFNLCLIERDNNENPKNFDVTKDKCRYYSSALKLQNMSKVLSNQRYVSFIN